MTAGRMWHAIERAKRAATYDEPEPNPKQDEIDKRWHAAQSRLRCRYYECEYFLDDLPNLTCTKGGKHRSLMSLPDAEEIADEICPYSAHEARKKK